ncbi:circularly permuted type 2 ATP-grasp protein [Acetobacter fallax]|uniref:DUF403 domain-containing protein n=1 Tax=Acetobacter fallax TaxID=1737473 RepID=A0ABX0K4F5_9PROT|nr:circularly permuted type 2 ATP-grasp protein [Acetobacter fallax]NHO31219.1 hypothetical protein [Acetobacter fallax]NHO34776.1 hypothetical protein [Acetobacter fallax]
MTGTIPVDEMVDGRGGVRPHWRRLLGVISDIGHKELLARRQHIALALSDQTGMPVPAIDIQSTHRQPGADDPPGVLCDPIPLILPADEFAALEAGVIQRAQLLEAILKDIYGKRTILDERLLPSALVWANHGFLRGGTPDGSSPLPDRFLSFYAVDLVRGLDGQWSVLADRASRANGAGLALENRRQMTRLFPELFAGQDLRRLTPFLELWQESLQNDGLTGASNPGLALLTPGPAGPHWGEHVILARELGCVLAEAGDLTVREGELWLKTVRGLRRVDVLLIRQNADTVDPLELEGQGTAGIAGLLDAARAGSVRLMNDPRVGFVEAPGLMPFLAPLSRHLLGEDLLLGNLETIWLGDDLGQAFLNETLFPPESSGENGAGWVVASALDLNTSVTRLAGLDAARRMAFQSKVRAAPWRYVACRAPHGSVAPTVAETGIVPRPVVLRLFAAHDGSNWSVLPGGLGRVFADDDAVTIEPVSGPQVTKDVWVTTDERFAPREHPVPHARPLPIRRSQGDLPSRAADDFFWLGRYLEQLEGAARLLHVVLAHLSGPDPSPRERADLDVLMRQMRVAGLAGETALSGYAVAGMIRELSSATSKDGLFALLLRKIIRLVPELTDRLTREMRDFITHQAHAILRAMETRPSRGDPGQIRDFLTDITGRLLAYGATLSGLAAENMVRSGGRQFMDLGRRIERASAVLLSCAGILEQPDVHQRGRMEGALRLMLELCDSVITYRSRYFGVVQPAPVLDLLLLDDDNPRGAGFQLTALRDSLAELASEDESTAPSAQRAASAELASAASDLLEMLSCLVSSVMKDPDQDRAAAILPEALRQAQASVMLLSGEIGRCYFSVLNSPRLVGISEDGSLDEAEA